MRSALTRLTLSIVAALSLTSCDHPAEPVATAPPPPPPLPAIHRPVASTWAFHAGEDCSATASGPGLSLEVTASSGKLVIVAHVGRGTAMPAHPGVPIAFAGASGSWTVHGHIAPSHQVIASQAMTDDRAGQILVLLEGGIITVGSRIDGLPRLRIPNGGPAGNDWFECVRRQLFP
jgi:hypothetical protein